MSENAFIIQKLDGMRKCLINQRFTGKVRGLDFGKNEKKILFRIIEKLFEETQNKVKGIYIAAVKKG